MSVKHADTFQHEFVSILAQTRIHIYKHLQSSKPYKDACNDSCFKIIDRTKLYHHLKIKEAMHILWEKPNINKQVQHCNISVTFQPFQRFSFSSLFELFFVILSIDFTTFISNSIKKFSISATDDGLS